VLLLRLARNTTIMVTATKPMKIRMLIQEFSLVCSPSDFASGATLRRAEGRLMD